MNYCRKCQSDYEKPGTCNCFASVAPTIRPAPSVVPTIPWIPYVPTYPTTYPWWQQWQTTTVAPVTTTTPYIIT